jgi:hypothetical protein
MKFWLRAVLTAAFLWGWAGAANALPVSGFVADDPRCDPVGSRVVEELGLPLALGGPFPTGEGIFFLAVPTTLFVCVPDDGLPNDWLVLMTNLTPNAYGDGVRRPLFFVANVGNTIGNSDGVADFTPFPGPADAFQINSTGMNDNLIFESFGADEIFAPGETWGFLVTNFVVPAAPGAPPSFVSLGHSVGVTPGGGTASIVVGIVPEPSTWAMMALAGIGLGGLARSRRRAAQAA